MKKTIVIISGGLDSSTLLYLQRKQFNDEDILVLFFNYGQKNYLKEKQAVEMIVPKSIQLKEINVADVFSQSASSLVNPKITPYIITKENEHSNFTPNKTVVEFRNGIFVSTGISIAQQLYSDYEVDIVLGTYGNNPIFYDCSADFYSHFDELAAKQSNNKHHVLSPLSGYSKQEVFNIAVSLGVPVDKTWSCFLGGDTPCGICSACVDRLMLGHSTTSESV